LLLLDGLNRRITWVVDFYDTTNPLYRLWQHALPNYLEPSAMTWVLHGAWLVLTVVVALRAYSTVNSVTIPSWK
jgi:hypothetical protein